MVVVVVVVVDCCFFVWFYCVVGIEGVCCVFSWGKYWVVVGVE